MKTLPSTANLDHLKKQAKDLLRLYRNGDPTAIARFVRSLPAAAHRTADAVVALGLRLHDAQSCVAREYGFASWADLRVYVESLGVQREQRALIRHWLGLVYGGDVVGGYDAGRPRVAARVLRDHPELASSDVSVACAAGRRDIIARAVAADPDWINRADGPLNLPPLVAVTHSRLGQLPEFVEGLRDCVRFLLDAGADPNARIGNRYAPASLDSPDASQPLSALYGAAGVNRDAVMTEMLLNAGAHPDDGESLYHSLEAPACTRLLLKHGARVGGTNALRRALDMPDAVALELLLAHGGDPNEPVEAGPTVTWGPPLLRAIAVRRSARHIAALLGAGADPRACTPAGVSAYRLALQTGLREVADLLRAAGADDTLSAADEFIAACARADAAGARRIQARDPGLPHSLAVDQLRLLPDTAAWGSVDAVKVMVEVGWPLAVRGGDWDASALNHAVFRGDAGLTGFLLAHGASWREMHGFGSDVLGTLSWASVNEPEMEERGDWVGCALALVAHGVPDGQRDSVDPERVLIDGRWMRFSEDVAEVLGRGC